MQDKDITGRRDLRGERTMSIDPPGCQDIDDAMHVTRKPNGKLQVWCGWLQYGPGKGNVIVVRHVIWSVSHSDRS